MITTTHRDKQRQRFDTLIEDVADPDVELTVETTAPIVATFQALRRAGEKFDRALCVIMDKLREQLCDGTREGCIEDHEDSDGWEDDDPSGDMASTL